MTAHENDLATDAIVYCELTAHETVLFTKLIGDVFSPCAPFYGFTQAKMALATMGLPYDGVKRMLNAIELVQKWDKETP